jgi:hypothetical protein
MTRDQFIKHYGEKRIGEVSGILHNYLLEDGIDKHTDLERSIRSYSSEKVKDVIHLLDPLLEFEYR